MKKMMFMAATALFAVACTNSDSTTSVSRDSTTHTDTYAGSEPAAYTPTEGDVTYRNGKVLVWRNNDWSAADREVTLNDGTVVRQNGTVVRENKTIELHDGEVVDKSGRFFDKAGHAIDNAWQDTKEAVKKGAGEVEQGAKKGVNKLKEVVNGKNDQPQ